ncbi:RNA helicase [Ranunculus cassubicifolius]
MLTRAIKTDHPIHILYKLNTFSPSSQFPITRRIYQPSPLSTMAENLIKIDPKTFGDRAFIQNKKRIPNPNNLNSNPSSTEIKRRKITKQTSVLDLLSSSENTYKPKSKETESMYADFLSIIQQQLGWQPDDVIHSAAYEILVILKNERNDSLLKKKEIEKILNEVSSEKFHHMMSISRVLNDFRCESEVSFNSVDELAYDDVGISVEFDKEEDEEEGMIACDLVEEEEIDEGECGAMEANADRRRIVCNEEKEDEEKYEAEKVNVQQIGAYWLQSRVLEEFRDVEPEQRRKLAEDVLNLLSEDVEVSEVDKRLLVLFNFSHCSFIKFLLRNRLQIVWCTRLARASNEDEREKIGQAMRGMGPECVEILEGLHATRGTALERQKDLEKNIRSEARHLKEHNGTRGIEDKDMQSGWSKGKGKLLDLENFASRQAGFPMGNKGVSLPQGSFREKKKGYEEIHVPALTPKPFAPDEKLIKISDMPDWAQPAFEKMTYLNRVQSKVYQTALSTSENLLLCAPTGAGKTNVAMLAILQQMALNRNPDGSINNSAYKIVYVAPMKALIAEIVGNLSKRLQHYNVQVKELSGDQTLTHQQIEESQILVTTPEKWDIVTRKSGDRMYTQLVKLLIIDEIHLLHDNRGPVLESIVARTVRQIETTKEHVRLVGLSATLPNYEDVAVFLRVDREKGLFYFDNSYRPCPLAQQYIGFHAKKTLERFQLMNQVCYEKVINEAGKHQVLIFVHSRRETTKTACAIRDTAFANDNLGLFLKEDSASHEILRSRKDLVKSNDLKDLLSYGFAIHHAGLERTDRELVEELFADGHVQVLVSTATLAWGVNLPAHTVIIKGTQVYNPDEGSWTELSPLDLMQMLGRAGRPQYDSCGKGIVLTGQSELTYYMSLMNQQLPIESQFISKLADQLNAEIVLGSVRNAREACNWISYTYLYVRMLRNPTLYGLSPHDLTTDMLLEQRRADLIHSAATILDKNNLVKYDKRSGSFQVTDLGQIASYYYLSYATITTYNEHLMPTMGDIDLFQLFSRSDEFKYVTVRQEEKEELTKLMGRVPIPVKDSMEEPSAKINVLLQAYISGLKLEGFSLMSDMVFITQSAGRLTRALFEIALKRGWAQLAEKALNLYKMVTKRMWSIQTPLRQFPGIPDAIFLQLEKKGLAWERYYSLSSAEIKDLISSHSSSVHRNFRPWMFKSLHKMIHQIPKLHLAAQVQPMTRTLLRFVLTITPDFQWDEKVHGHSESFWIMVVDNDGESILHYEYFVLKKQYIEEDHTLNFTVPISEPLPPQYFIRVVSDRWLGSEVAIPVSFKYLILPEKYPPPTELLDLQPLPVSALRNPAYEAIYHDYKHFSPVQTQVFTVLYNTDDNVLVAAPSGAGKTACAEFALLRNHQKTAESVMRAVYIAPVEALAKERYCDWERKFGKGLGLMVVELTGEIASDLRLLEKGQLIISTPEKWEMLSRRWKQKMCIQQISLFIVDDLHLVGGQGGPAIEVIVSRMRYISNASDRKLRLVALSASVANANDLGDWIGATSRGLFNFAPGASSDPLEIHIQGVDITNYEARMQAMAKPTYTAVVHHARIGKRALIFVPTSKQARCTALDLMAFLDEDGEGEPVFLQHTVEELEPLLSKVTNRMLSTTLRHGIGYLHEGLGDKDQKIVSQLFKEGRIQVCVSSSSMCWRMSLATHLVVVMGTECYDGCENSYIDYPISDLLQMMGNASKHLLDNSSKCVILCHASREKYYKKFLLDAFPVESHLQHYLHDNLNAEIKQAVIKDKQDAVDYLTWTFMYRRLKKNPNYYNLLGVGHSHLQEHLSELVENTLGDLEAGNFVSIKDMIVSPLNLGRIAAYYCISYTTIECFSSSLNAKTNMKGLLEILSFASEYEQLPNRPHEEELVRRLINHQRFSFKNSKVTDSHMKANALLQAHFSRHTVVGNLAVDQRDVLVSANKLLQAMVDVIASNGWFSQSLLAMEVSQMVTQGIWKDDSVLLQVPHFTKELATRCQENPGKRIETVFDLAEMEDKERCELLQMSDSQLLDVSRFCNNYPNIDVSLEVVDSGNVTAGVDVTLIVTLERDLNSRSDVGPVDAPRYPKAKEEGWWLVVGDSTNQLLTIKRISIHRKSSVMLKFLTPAEAGTKRYTLCFMCDSYLGCDQEFDFTINVKEAEVADDYPKES